MTAGTLDSALTREHREIDEGIEVFTRGEADPETRIASIRGAMAALRRHIYLEEAFLFPPLQEAGMFGPIFVMLREHGEMWTAMNGLDVELSDRPGSAATIALCQELVAGLEAHNLKEEQILYSQADGVLSAEATGALAKFLAAGAMPEDWVCDGARR